MSWTYGQRISTLSQFMGSASSSWSFIVGTSIAAGALAVLHIPSSNGNRLPSAVVDNVGNTWDIDRSASSAGFGKGVVPASVIATSVLTTALTAGSGKITVTVPVNGSNTSYFASTLDTFLNTTPAAQVQDGGASNTGTATAMSTGSTPTPSPGDLCLASFAVGSTTATITGLPSGYTLLPAFSYGSVQGRLAYNLSVSTSQNVTATLNVNIAWAATAQLYSSAVLGANYPIELDATESIASTLAIIRGYARPALFASVSEGATLAMVKSRILPVTTLEGARLTKALPPKRLTAGVSIAPTLTRNEIWARALNATVSSVTTLKTTKGRVLNVVVSETVVSLRRVPGKIFLVEVVEVVGLNKKGKYKQPPAVLQLYDLVDPYQLPNLKGATVSYMHGFLGVGVMFDVYAAYILAGGAFYVADNGLKEALDQHPAVARAF